MFSETIIIFIIYIHQVQIIILHSFTLILHCMGLSGTIHIKNYSHFHSCSAEISTSKTFHFVSIHITVIVTDREACRNESRRETRNEFTKLETFFFIFFVLIVLITHIILYSQDVRRIA